MTTCADEDRYVESSTAPIAPGVYSIGSADGVSAAFNTADATCAATTYTAASGTVTLKSIRGAAIEGSYDLTFNDATNSRATGSFESAGCALTGAEVCAHNSIANIACH